MIKNQRELRREFWASFPELETEARRRRTRSKGQNAQTCDTRMTFCDWLDGLSKSGQVSDRLASNATL
jgi:hypothetical protein